MNFRVIAKILSFIALIMALSMGACAVFALVVANDPDARPVEHSAVGALGISTLISFVVFLALFLSGLGSRNEVLRREAIVIVGLSWFQAAILGLFPYVLCDPGLDIIPAYFESASGITTTGSSVMNDIESFPLAVLLWRSVSQFLGGIGILVVFVSILSFIGAGSRSLMTQESSLNLTDSGAARVKDAASLLLKVYLILTVACGLGMYALGMPAFEAVCHAMTAVATGGFSPKNASLGHYDSVPIELWTASFMFLGSISFLLYVFLLRRNWDRIRAEEEARYYVVLLLCAIVAIALDLVLVEKKPFWYSLEKTFFNVVSLSSTTGFAAGDYDEWPLFSRMLLMAIMTVGGCAGSTAGGIKMNRIILFKRIAVRELSRSFRPHQVMRIKLNGLRPDEHVFVTTSFFIALAFAIGGMASVLVALMQPELDFTSTVGCVFATLFNIGPGFAEVGPTDNFGFLKPGTLLLLSFLMVLGRLEFFAVLVLLVPALWRKY